MTATDKRDNSGDGTTSATLEHAMAQTGFGVYNIIHMLLSGLILMGVIMQCLVLGYVLPVAQCDLQLTLQQRGVLAALPFLAIIVTSYVWGWLADTRGRRSVMLVSMTISAVFSCLASFAPDITTFALFIFLSAVFTSGPSAVVYTYLGEFSSAHHRDKVVAFGSSFVGIGTVMLPAVSWVILAFSFSIPIDFLDIHYRPWRLLIVACALPFVMGTTFLAFFPESPKFLNASGKTTECLEVLRKMYSVNKRKPHDTFPVKSLLTVAQPSKTTEHRGAAAVLISMRDQTVPLFRAPLLPWTCLTCFVQFGIFATTNGFYVWFPSILNAVVNHDGDESNICGILNSVQTTPTNETIVECDDKMNETTFELSIYVGLVFCSMYIIVGFLVDFVGKKLIIMVILFCTGFCGIGAHLVTSQHLAVMMFAVFQMCGACIGLMNAVTVELFPTKYRAMAVCLSMMTGRLGSMVGSNLIGVFLATNCGLSFYVFGGIVIVCAICCVTLPNQMSTQLATKSEVAATETRAPA